jgi:hypothetical protein
MADIEHARRDADGDGIGASIAATRAMQGDLQPRDLTTGTITQRAAQKPPRHHRGGLPSRATTMLAAPPPHVLRLGRRMALWCAPELSALEIGIAEALEDAGAMLLSMPAAGAIPAALRTVMPPGFLSYRPRSRRTASYRPVTGRQRHPNTPSLRWPRRMAGSCWLAMRASAE